MGFYEVVKRVWSTDAGGSPGNKFSKKLRLLRRELKVWNWDIFGNVDRNVSSIQTSIAALEIDLQCQWSVDIYEKCKQLSKDLQQNISWQHELIRQKTRLKWIEEGDRNSRYFHASHKARRKSNSINLKLEDGTFTNGQIIGAKAVDYFQSLFQASPFHIDEDLFFHIPPRVSSQWNYFVATILDINEIYTAKKDLSADSSLGQDGFTGHFYLKCWDIIKDDIQELIEGFFMGDMIPVGMATTLLILLPKMADPYHLS